VAAQLAAHPRPPHPRPPSRRRHGPRDPGGLPHHHRDPTDAGGGAVPCGPVRALQESH